MKKSFLTLLALAGFAFAAQAQTTPAPNTSSAVAPAKKGPGIIARPAETLPVAGYYEGGQEALYAFLNQELKYPELARRTRQQGRCLLDFTLNADGSLGNVRVLLNPGGGIGDEAVRLLRLIKFKRPDNPIILKMPMDFKLSAPSSNTTTN